jgi:hypothetical protein
MRTIDWNIKKITTQLRLIIVLILTLQVLRFLPGMDYAEYTWMVICVLYFIGPYIIGKALLRISYSSFEIYLIFIVYGMTLIASFTTLNNFGQPVYYGLGTQRENIFCIGALYIIHEYNRGKISFANIEKTFLLMGWGSLIIFTFLNFYLDPTSDIYQNALTKKGYLLNDFRFNFNQTFIVFSFIYYSVKGSLIKNRMIFFLSIPFLAYIYFLDTGRSVLIAMFLGTFLVLIKKRKIADWMTLITVVGIFFILLVLPMQFTEKNYIVIHFDRIKQAILLVLTQHEVNDISSNARIYEANIAIPLLSDHLLLGHGRLSSLWSGGGYSTLLNRYFYPSDIGIIGLLFVYGYVGTLIYLCQFYFAWSCTRKIPRNFRYNVFVEALIGYIIYYAIFSIVSGYCAYFIHNGALMIAILYCAKSESTKKHLSPKKA